MYNNTVIAHILSTDWLLLDLWVTLYQLTFHFKHLVIVTILFIFRLKYSKLVARLYANKMLLVKPKMDEFKEV